LSVSVLRKPREPIAHELEPAAIDVVDASAPLAAVTKQPRRLEHLDVPRGRRPGMLEHVGDLSAIIDPPSKFRVSSIRRRTGCARAVNTAS